MTAVVYGLVRAASDGWGDRWHARVASPRRSSCSAPSSLNELRAEQPITPLRLFASRERAGAYVARMLVVGGMFSMFFFLTQFLQSVLRLQPARRPGSPSCR